MDKSLDFYYKNYSTSFSCLNLNISQKDIYIRNFNKLKKFLNEDIDNFSKTLNVHTFIKKNFIHRKYTSKKKKIFQRLRKKIIGVRVQNIIENIYNYKRFTWKKTMSFAKNSTLSLGHSFQLPKIIEKKNKFRLSMHKICNLYPRIKYFRKTYKKYFNKYFKKYLLKHLFSFKEELVTLRSIRCLVTQNNNKNLIFWFNYGLVS